MDRSLLIRNLRAIDMRVKKDGIVLGQDNSFYCAIRQNDIATSDGRYIPISEFSTLEYEGATKNLVIYDSIGNELCRISGREDSNTTVISEINAMPTTDSELNDLFPILYPDSYDKMYYDVLFERVAIDTSIFDLNKGIMPMSDYLENVYIDHIERRLKACGFFGRPPSVEVRRRVFDVQAHCHERNRFREWVESLEWDGQPRVATWFKKVFNGTAPPLQELGLEDEYLAKVSEAWFLGAIKKMYGKTQHDVVPVLIGRQGIGKSSALKYTAGSEEWFQDTTINISAPGGVERFLNSVRGKIIVELAESKSIRSSDQDDMKAFISKTEDQLRKSYARYESIFPRHFILAASTNISNVFTDITGNRRYYPIYCKQMSNEDKIKNRRQYDVEQVWAEALHLYREDKAGRSNHKWYIENTWKPAVIMQAYSTQDNFNISVIEDWLDDPNNGYTELNSRITKNDIVFKCFGLDINRPIPKDCAASLKAWANGTNNWEKSLQRVNGKVSRCWVRINPPGDNFVYNEKEIDKKIEEIELQNEDNHNDLISLMRKRSEKYGFRETGDSFPTDDLSQYDVNRLLDEGYIYDAGINDFRLGVLP